MTWDRDRHGNQRLHGLTVEQWASCKHDFNHAHLMTYRAMGAIEDGTNEGLGHEAVKWMAVIMYCRPFLSNRDASGTRTDGFRLPLPGVLEDIGFPAERSLLEAFHEQLLSLRDQAVAHSDARGRSPFFAPGEYPDVDWHGATELFVPDEYVPLLHEVVDQYESTCLRRIMALRKLTDSTTTSSGTGQRFDAEPGLVLPDNVLADCAGINGAFEVSRFGSLCRTLLETVPAPE